MAHFLFQDCHRRANSQRGVLCPIFVNQLSNSLFHCFDGHASSHRFQVTLWIATIVSLKISWTVFVFGLPDSRFNLRGLAWSLFLDSSRASNARHKLIEKIFGIPCR